MLQGQNNDRIVRLAAGLFDVPMAMLAVLDGDEPRAVASIGADTPAAERALATWARRIAVDGLTVVPDIRPEGGSGQQLAGSMAVPVRFVAGVPVTSEDGKVVATLLVADRLPRPDLGPNERVLLGDLAALVQPAGSPGESSREEGGGAGAGERSGGAAGREIARLRAELESLAGSQNRFFAAANHDLRQPFQAMHLFLHLLKGRLADPRQVELAERLEQALRNGESMLTGLLDLTVLEAGRVRPAPVRIRPGEVLERLVAEFEQEALAKGLRLRYVPSGLSVETDPGLLERVVRHLLANAIQATESGSVLLGCRRRGAGVAVEVWDTGPGIPPDQQKAVWEPFHQVASRTADRSGRLGVGLAIVRGTARKLGGSAELCSRPGRGSMFRVLLPSSEGGAEDKGKASAGREERLPIVVIEDDPVQLMAVRMILEGWGCRVIAAPSCEKALAAVAQSGPPGLVLSDLRLRGTESGLDAVAELRRVVGGTVPAILMTGDTGPEQISATREAGANLLHKPFGPEHLRTAIEAATGWSLGQPGG
jgi:two-component system, sensor histidine kinase